MFQKLKSEHNFKIQVTFIYFSHQLNKKLDKVMIYLMFHKLELGMLGIETRIQIVSRLQKIFLVFQIILSKNHQI